MKNTLKISNLAFSREENHIFKDFSIVCTSESVSLFEGKNGIGKSTLLDLIAGIETPSHGLIELNNSVFQNGQQNIIPTESRKIGYIFQDFGLFAHLTVKENICFSRGNVTDQEVSIITSALGLDEILEKDIDKISGGQQQRTAIARTLISSPIIILADEPFSNLDEEAARNIQRFLFNWVKQKNQILILVSHNSETLIEELKQNTIFLG